MGKRSNQSFVGIPFFRLLRMIRYKAKLNGIGIMEIKEGYTSKCSSLDLEEIEFHLDYLGERNKRGMFITSENQKIHADINSSLNMIRLVQDSFDDYINQEMERARKSDTKPKFLKSPKIIDLYRNSFRYQTHKNI